MEIIQKAKRYLATAPGRVNLLGEHVDYNGGIVLPAAIDRTVKVIAEPSHNRIVSIEALDIDQSVEFDMLATSKRVDIHGDPLPSWALYPAGVAWILDKHGYQLHGFQATFTSNIPIGAGLSSSAAVEVVFAVLWQELGGWDMDRLTLARLCQEAENHYVGVNCGLMDQFAVANGVEDHAMAFDTRSLEWRAIPLPPKTSIIIADSGVRRSLVGSAYNDRRRACEEAVRLLGQRLPGIRTLRDVTPLDFSRFSSLLPDETRLRAQHIVEEISRVNQALEILKKGDAQGFGKLMFTTHESLRDLYEVSCDELDALVEIAQRLEGVYGARLTGAGFGGCTVNLVKEELAHSIVEKIKTNYVKTCGRQAEVYLCRASSGAKVEVQKQ